MKFVARALFTIFILVAWALAAGAVNKNTAKALVRDFNESPRAVRPEHPLVPVNFVEYEGETYAYYVPRKFTRLAEAGQTFLIKKLEYKREHLLIRFQSDRGAPVHWTVYDRAELSQRFVDQVLPKVLRSVFAFGVRPEFTPFVGNLRSRKLHVGNCNHLPEPSERVEFQKLESVGDYERCPICFSAIDVLPIEGYSQLRERQLEQARLFEIAFPPVEDLNLQSEMRGAGESVLANFPIPLKGFEYSFKVVTSELPNATSFPTGFVYITDQLIRAIEDKAELAFVLAHEIAHTELYREIPVPTTYTLQAIEAYYRQLRFRETTADLIAFLYVIKNDDRNDAADRAIRVLRKLQFARESHPIQKEDPYSTHPSLRSRIAFFDPSRYAVSTFQESFCGVDAGGDTIVRLQILGKGKTDSETILQLLVETTDYSGKLDLSRTRPMGRGIRGNGRIVDGAGHEYVLRLGADSPGKILEKDLILVDFSIGGTSRFEQLDVNAPHTLELAGVSTVEHWIVCED